MRSRPTGIAWERKGSAAFALLAQQKGTASSAASSAEIVEPFVQWVSQEGADIVEPGRGQEEKPWRTLPALVTNALKAPTSTEEFEQKIVMRVRGQGDFSNGGVAVVLPTGNFYVEAGPGVVLPPFVLSWLDSERFTSPFPAFFAITAREAFQQAIADCGVTLTADTVSGNCLEIDSPALDLIQQPAIVLSGVRVNGDVRSPAGPVFAYFLTTQGCVFGGSILDDAAALVDDVSSFFDPLNLQGIGRCNNSTFEDDVSVQQAFPGVGATGLNNCFFGTGPHTFTIPPGSSTYFDEVSRQRMQGSGWTIPTGSPRVIDAASLINTGTVGGREVWVSQGSGVDEFSEDRGSRARPWQTWQAAIAALCPVATTVAEFLQQWTWNLLPGTYSNGGGGIVLPTRAQHMVYLHGASVLETLTFQNSLAQKFGSGVAPFYQVQGLRDRVQSPVIVGPAGVGVVGIQVVPPTPGDDAPLTSVSLFELRLYGELAGNGTLGAVSIEARDVNFFGSGVGTFSARGTLNMTLDLVRCAMIRLCTVQQVIRALDSQWNDNVVIDVQVVGNAGLNGFWQGNRFFLTAGKSITFTNAAQILRLDGFTNYGLKTSGWAVHPATTVVTLTDDPVAIIAT